MAVTILLYHDYISLAEVRNNLVTSLIALTSFLQVVNSLFQTCVSNHDCYICILALYTKGGNDVCHVTLSLYMLLWAYIKIMVALKIKKEVD